MSETTELDKTRRYLVPVARVDLPDEPDIVHLALYEWVPRVTICWRSPTSGYGDSRRRGYSVETHIPLIVRNVNLDDDGTAEQLALNLSDFGWHETGGQVIATFYTTLSDPVAAAAAAALSIKRVVPQAFVERVDEQFVSLADIATRAGLSHEAVRLWAAGKRRTAGEPFPAPRAQVGQGRTATKIWAWPEVLAWFKVHYCLDLEPGTAYLTAQQVARLNVLLQRGLGDGPGAVRPFHGAGSAAGGHEVTCPDCQHYQPTYEAVLDAQRAATEDARGRRIRRDAAGDTTENGAWHAVWLESGTWRWTTQTMTTPQREYAADCVAAYSRYLATCDGDLERGEPEGLRWWREASR